MSAKIEQPSSLANSALADPTLPSAQDVLALVDALRNQKVDPGTAELVSRVTAQLRGTASARKTAVELRAGDDFHDGFANALYDLSARVKREGQATLTLHEASNGMGATMSIQISGPPKIVEGIEQEIRNAALGAVDELRWT